MQEALVALDRLRLATTLDRRQPRRRHFIELHGRSTVRDERSLLAGGLHVDGEGLRVALAPDAALRSLAAIGVAIADLIPDRLPAVSLAAKAPVVDGTDVRHRSSSIPGRRVLGR